MNQVKFFALGSAIAVCSLFMGCGSSPRVYTLSGLAPSEAVAGAGDFTLTVSGSDFTNDSKVVFGGTTLIPGYLSKTQLRVIVPSAITAKAGVVDVAVTGSAIPSTLPFTIKNPAPTLIGLSQETALLNSGAVTLEVTGTNFVATSTVKVGDKSLVPTSVNPTGLAVVVPETSLTTAQAFPVAADRLIWQARST